MSTFKLIATNLVTALVTVTVTSMFWIGAYGNEPDQPAERKPAHVAPAKVASTELIRGPSGLAIPVAGIKPAQLLDTYTQSRGGGARVHDAIDIMAPAGTPVVAAAPGTVEKLFFSKGGGGITAYVRSSDGRWIYYYAHLKDYARGLAEGQKVKQGSLIGTVGSTGNANPEGPHLHFAVHRVEPGEKWYSGRAINPYPLLAGKKAGS